MKNNFSNNSKITFSETNYETLDNSDALIILTEWDEFRMPNFIKMKELMKSKIVID